MVGRVEEYLLKKIHEEGAVHITLIDPEEGTSKSASLLSRESEMCHSSAIMVGGTTFVSSTRLDAVVKDIKKKVEIPLILFPNNITGVSKYADAIASCPTNKKVQLGDDTFGIPDRWRRRSSRGYRKSFHSTVQQT
jgi:heptaprenylglyceryl phosphate synthase